MIRDNRNPLESQTDFIELNRDAFKFLDIKAYQSRGNLHLVTNGFVGAVPLRMPGKGNGRTITDLVIKPRYGVKESNWFEWMNALAEFAQVNLDPETTPNLKLTRSAGTPTPLYMMAQDVIRAMVPVIKLHNWQQFNNQKTQLAQPGGNVDWSHYASQYTDPQKRLLFPTTVNVMTQNHEEFNRAKNVLLDAMTVIDGRLTPNRVKQNIHNELTFIKRQLIFNQSFSHESKLFKLNKRESSSVQQLKRALNKFIGQKAESQYGWRIDFSILFERYVQKVLEHTVSKVENNTRIAHEMVAGYQHQVSRLMPKYLEPDMVGEFAGQSIVFDAKYKSYFFSRQGDGSESQHERIRQDVHQIIAYTSLIGARVAIIIAPVDGEEVVEEVSLYGPITVGVIGVPLMITQVEKITQHIHQFLRELTRTQN